MINLIAIASKIRKGLMGPEHVRKLENTYTKTEVDTKVANASTLASAWKYDGFFG